MLLGARKIGEEVISHLAGLVGAKLTVTLEIAAEMLSAAPERSSQDRDGELPDSDFDAHGFERE